MEERTLRIGLNEAVFREVNERVDALTREQGVDAERLDLLCECGDASCVERISLTTVAYSELRSDPTLFAVVPGHEAPEVERVVSTHGGYDVVAKLPGVPTEVAEETDPRS